MKVDERWEVVLFGGRVPSVDGEPVFCLEGGDVHFWDSCFFGSGECGIGKIGHFLLEEIEEDEESAVDGEGCEEDF